MNKEEILNKLGVCRKESPAYPIVEAMRGKKITKFSPNIEFSIQRKMDRNSMLIKENFEERHKHDPDFRKLYHSPKKQHNEFGYYISTSMSDVLNIMNILGIKKICDIGCGFGVAMKILQNQDSSIMYRGYDNEQYLIDISGDRNLYCKDALKLKRGDVDNDELIYMWEPFRDKTMSLSFVNNLSTITDKGQIIVTGEFPYENTVTNLLNHKSFDYVCNFGKKYMFVRNEN